MTALLAIDPGLENGFAVLDKDTSDLVLASEIPTLGEGHARRLGLARFKELIIQFHVDEAVIEDVSAMPKQGVSSSFRFGRATGQMEGALMALQIPTHFVRPALWKRAYGVGASKNRMRALAAQTFPRHQARFERVRDTHRAEAAMMGVWFLGRRK
jgi:Holliday junction resolvasome RuvABC endonuclease subunit